MKTFFNLINQIELLKKEVVFFNIGKSTLGKKITCFKLGKDNSKRLLILGGINGCEFVSAFLVVKLIKFFKNFNLNCCVYFIPLVNPDGVDISLNSSKNIKRIKQKKLITCMLKYFSKKTFKANANGVEINKNFETFWGGEKCNNKFTPLPESFIGKTPNSQSETKALINFLKKIKPEVILNYCGIGSEIICFTKNKNKTKKGVKLNNFLKILKQNKYKLKFKKQSCGSLESFSLENFNSTCFRICIKKHSKNKSNLKAQVISNFNENKDVVLSLLNL